MKKAVILSALLVSGTAAFAQSQGETTETTKVGPNQDPNQVVCRTETQIGSRLDRRRVCRTRAEWAELRAQSRNEVERTQRTTPVSGQ